MSKDTIKVNMNVYDIPIVVEQLKKLEQENKQLKEQLDKAIEYIKDNSTKYNGGVDEDYITKELYEEDIGNLLEILGDKENES